MKIKYPIFFFLSLLICSLIFLSSCNKKSSEKKKSAVLVECLSNLLANEMFLPGGKIVSSSDAAGKVISGLKRLFSAGNFISEIVLVSNNIFDDGLDYDEATKSYMEALAKINAFAAKNADKVFEVVAGIALEISGTPVIPNLFRNL